MTFSIFAFEKCNAKSIQTDMSRILLTIFCMWLPLQLMAQGFTVRGRVVDKLSRQPVAYANVSLYGNPGQGASTDSLGQFRIEHVAPGCLSRPAERHEERTSPAGRADEHRRRRESRSPRLRAALRHETPEAGERHSAAHHRPDGGILSRGGREEKFRTAEDRPLPEKAYLCRRNGR